MGRDLIVTENITIDSVIEAIDDWFVPSGAENSEHVAEMRAVEERLRSTADAVLLGRKTFEAFREYWPFQTDDETGVSDYLNQVDKYVVSSTLDDPKWDHTTVLRGDLAEAVRSLKEQPGVAGCSKSRSTCGIWNSSSRTGSDPESSSSATGGGDPWRPTK